MLTLWVTVCSTVSAFDQLKESIVKDKGPLGFSIVSETHSKTLLLETVMRLVVHLYISLLDICRHLVQTCH